jgi:hypothetical protein
LLVAETRHADRRHAASLGCLHATRRILDDETHLRRESEFLRSRQEDHRIGFPAGEVTAGDVGVEQLLQGHPIVHEAVVEALLGSEGVKPDPF